MQSLLRARCGRQPPVVTSNASCSGRTATSFRCPLLRTNRRHIVEPCRITSTAKELFQSDEAKRMGMEDKGDDEYMDLPNYQLFDPDKGPLEKRIQRSYLEALNDDKVDLRETEYWFSTPPEGWNSEPKRVYFMEELEPQFPQPFHPEDEDDDAPDRISFSELEEGRVVLGVVSAVWLYHGVQIDFGADFDGLVPCNEDLWELAVDHIDIGDFVMVEIHKLRPPGLYRWPVQLKFTMKSMQDLMIPPDEYKAPVDHAFAEEAGLTLEEVSALTGRTMEVPSYFLPIDEQVMAEQIIDGYGTGDMYWRQGPPSAPIEDYIDDPLDDPAEQDWLGHGSDEAEAAAQSLASKVW